MVQHAPSAEFLRKNKMFLYKKAISSGRNKKTCLSCVKNTTVFVNFIATALMLLLPAFALANDNCSKAFSEKNNSSKTNRFMPYNEAKNFALSLKFRNKRQFEQWARSGNRPHNFPANPRGAYKEEWEGYGIFLGTNNTQHNKKQFMSYSEAKDFAHSLNLHSKRQFEQWARSGNRPPNFPADPRGTYKEEWEGYGIFLGTNNTQHNKKQFMSYDEAKNFALSLKLRNVKQFKKWTSSGGRPPNFPADPRGAYKEEWENWGVFLGTGNIHNRNKKFMSYDEAKKFIQFVGIHSVQQFKDWSKLGKRPPNFPAVPRAVYKDKWQGWRVFLGKKFMPYNEAKNFVLSLKFRNKRQFHKWAKLGSRPHNFPADPRGAYKEEWEGYGIFLGTNNTQHNKKQFMSYSEAKDFARSLNLHSKRQFEQWSKSGNRPHNFPADPRGVYKEEWEGYGIFLGTISAHPIRNF